MFRKSEFGIFQVSLAIISHLTKANKCSNIINI